MGKGPARFYRTTTVRGIGNYEGAFEARPLGEAFAPCGHRDKIAMTAGWSPAERLFL